jgi:gamma-glutamylcyclotransferase (GGCT)/AIG2-like uncharacterized protein YtfP
MMDKASTFDVFVYGTLKRGERNFERYCSGYIAVRSAHICGTLLLRHTGTPIIQYPEASILYRGTADLMGDLEVQRTQGAVLLESTEGAPAKRDSMIEGELFTFAAEEDRVAKLDYLEEFQADAPSLYDRILAPVYPSADCPEVPVSPVAAWVYIVPQNPIAPDPYRPCPNPTAWHGHEIFGE